MSRAYLNPESCRGDDIQLRFVRLQNISALRNGHALSIALCNHDDPFMSGLCIELVKGLARSLSHLLPCQLLTFRHQLAEQEGSEWGCPAHMSKEKLSNEL